MTQTVFTPPCEAKQLFHGLDYPNIEQLVRSSGLTLPDDYLRFLKEWNGLQLAPPFGQEVIFPLDGSKHAQDYGRAHRFFGFSETKDLYDLRFAGDGYNFRRRVPAHILSIGDNGHWERPCISLGDLDFGHIYYWRPGEGWPPEEEEEAQSTEYLYWVARGFRVFWNLLELVEVE